MLDTLSPLRPNAIAPSQEHDELAPPRRWSLRSLALITFAWFTLQIGGLFSPGLLDDVDSIYIEIAREMLHRHDFVTPYINGMRFFDKPPLMYWMAAGSMRLFGETDWGARLPLALAALALFLSVYALGTRLFGERGGLYAALATATSIGPYLYTRFFIPDILICLWMTLGVHLFLIALNRLQYQHPGAPSFMPYAKGGNLLPSLAFAAVLALNLLTKGLIGIVFPVAIVAVYLLLTRGWRGTLRRLLQCHPLS
ncbi:MAG: glycosyltransferase family 39 protein, partial [Candidatus Eremiobacteraeota bacterium]|nr:glycosyltransferase family 39 protein [Candidatus Eremiobacteraeota bacterium]